MPNCFGILHVQALPSATNFSVFGADHAPNGMTCEEAIQYIKADVPARGAHGNKSAVDVVPQGEPGTIVTERLQFPADVLPSPVKFERPRILLARLT